MTKSAHRSSRILFFVALASCVPQLAFAAVSISEVAWMGSTDSANHEWIELYNSGQAENVDDWVLNDGMNLEIALSGTIPASSYAVLERTSDVSAPGGAFLIYTGAMVNTGATLRLENESGALIDQVSGGADWQNIGGDNTTKETAQYTDSGWITAEPTPGGPAPSVLFEDEEDTKESPVESTEPASKSSSGKSGTVQLTLPDVTLELEVDAPVTGYVNQTIPFSVEASGVGETIIDSLSYNWNFGDGFSSTRSETEHIFQYPGTYVVTIHAEYKRQKQVARHEITILPIRLSLTENQAGDIQLNNDSPYELDVSSYAIKGHNEFVLPPFSILLPNQTITIPREYVAESESVMVAVYDAMRQLVASDVPRAPSESIAKVTNIEQVPPPQPIISATRESRVSEPPAGNFSFSADDKTAEPNLKAIEPKSQTAQVQSPEAIPTNWGTVGFIALLILGTLGIYLIPRRNEIS